MKIHFSKQKLSLSLLGLVPASLAAAGALGYLRYRRDMKAAKARVSSGSKLANTVSGLIEYANVGTGAPVLVVHGAGGGFDQGVEFARPLIENGFTIIAPSRFGYLRTPLPKDPSPTAQAEAHAHLLDTLGLDKVAVVAASAGAPSAMQFCLRYPERCTAMVLIVPLAYNGRPTSQKSSAFREFVIKAVTRSDFLFWAMSKLARNTLFKTVLGTPPADVKNAEAQEVARMTGFLSHIQPISRRQDGLDNETIIARSLPRYDLDSLHVPTLVIGIENCLYKTYPGARYTADNITGARFLSYPKGGHLAVGHETELWSEVIHFLKENEHHSSFVTNESVKLHYTKLAPI